jgi:hypothetical protein
LLSFQHLLPFGRAQGKGKIELRVRRQLTPTSPSSPPPLAALEAMSNWKSSIMSGAKIQILEERGFLPHDSDLRPAAGEIFPRPVPSEAVVLVEHFRCGFGTPAHDFLRSVLRELGIGLHLLHPDWLLQVAIRLPM